MSAVLDVLEGPAPDTSARAAKKGAMAGGFSLVFRVLLSDLEVYLIEEFNIKRISAAQICNLVNGSVSMIPIGAAILTDSFFSCYTVLWISSLVSSLGVLLLTITATFSKLRPPPCDIESSICPEPMKVQLTVLYLRLALTVLGLAGTRVTIVPMGAHQLDKPKDRRVFFNWFAFVMDICFVLSSTAIVYVINSVSWAWGFGITAAANVLGLLLFFVGTRFYRQLTSQGSPFAGLAQVVVRAVKNRRKTLSEDPRDYCQQDHENKNPTLPSKIFRFLNHAALKTEVDAEQNGSKKKSRTLCTVTEVEDLKILIKLLPLWTSAIIVCSPYIFQTSLGILQALTMDRDLGHNFKIPAAVINTVLSVSRCVTILFIDRILFPMWNKCGLQPITPLRRIGIGHLFYMLSMTASAFVEAKRLKILQIHKPQNQDNALVPMSIYWLMLPHALVGIAEAFNYPGQIEFFYQEFPSNLKSSSSAAVSLVYGISCYIGNALIRVFQRSSDWLPDNINNGRLDIVYWIIAMLVGINFCYFILCALSTKLLKTKWRTMFFRQHLKSKLKTQEAKDVLYVSFKSLVMGTVGIFET